MIFRSSLYPGNERSKAFAEEPSCFADLNLDQIVDPITPNKGDYDLKPFFHAPPGTLAAIRYRHDVMRDLEKEVIFAAVTRFARRMQQMRGKLERSEKLYYKQQKDWWFLDAITIYCETVTGLRDDLEAGEPKFRRLQGVWEWLGEYSTGAGFVGLAEPAHRIKDLDIAPLADSGLAFCYPVGNLPVLTSGQPKPTSCSRDGVPFNAPCADGSCQFNRAPV